MAWFPWLFSKRKEEENYETVLANLQSSITDRQTQLADIRLRERRATLLVTLYTLAGWGLYVALWYTGLVPANGYQGNGGKNAERLGKALMALPVIIGPIVILFTRRIVQMWYKRKGDAEEGTLKKLLKEQRDKIEEIKKKTNYYTTRNLLEKYDDSARKEDPNASLRKRAVGAPGIGSGTPIRNPNPYATPIRNPQQGAQGQVVPASAGGPSVGPILPPQFSPVPQQPMAPPQRQWFDKVADAILGDDDASSGSAHSRYALICEQCFSHNGLVREGDWENIQYVCPKCGHFNASVKSKRQSANQSSNQHEPISPSPSTSRHSSPALKPTPLSDERPATSSNKPTAKGTSKASDSDSNSGAGVGEEKMDVDS